MIANTHSILVGLVLAAAQVSNASPADLPSDFSSPIYPTATDSIPPLVKPTATGTAIVDACAQKCIDAHDKCNTAPDANHATCAAEFAGCLNYNPYDGKDGTLVYPTACSAATALASATPKPTGGETSKPAPTETNVIVNGAGRVSFVKVSGLVGAIGVAALAFL